MKSSIKTADALLAKKKKYKIQKHTPDFEHEIKIDVIGFNKVLITELPKRSISKIINPSTLIK